MTSLTFNRKSQLPIQLGDQTATIRMANGIPLRKAQPINLCLPVSDNNKILIAKATVKQLQHIRIYQYATSYKVTIDGQALTAPQFDNLAQKNGYNNHLDLVDYIKSTYRLPISNHPFIGVLISWSLR